jgi:putative peptide zinc metalloprotease protein
MRPDLIVRQQQSGSGSAWIVKDPVSLRYFTFTAQEFAILQWLRGANSLDEIRRAFEDAFPPFRITLLRLQSFLANLHESGLLLADGPDQGQLLLESGARQQRRERWQSWLNWLAIRFRGIDPDRFLSWAYPKLSWCFSRWFLAGCLLSVVAAIALISVHASEFQRQLPELHQIASPANLLWIVAAFVVAKVFHELGHAFTCKHYGGECHEMGFMLLVFVPCLYCNVTDSWMLQSRWQRMAVSAAGILVEIQLAALAVFCWWYSQPGALHTIALSMIMVCSIGSVLFNGNPLLRYDGYFVLADFLEMPNLWQESRAALKRRFAKWFLVDNAVARQAPDERHSLLTAYALSSMAYRLFVVAAILIFLHRALVPQGLGFLVPVVALSFLVAAAVGWLAALRRFWTRPMAWRQFYASRVLLASGVGAVAGWGFLTIPLPCRIGAPALLEPQGAHRVYVTTPGTLVTCASPGQSVHTDETLAQLEDAELHRDVVRLTGQQRVALARVQNLRARLADEPEAAAQLQVAEEMLADVGEQLRQRQRDEQALTLKAPIAGLVMEPPEVPHRPTSHQQLPMWFGTPLETENTQCYLERGTLFCLVGDAARYEAIVFVDETDVQYVRLGQRVRMQFSVVPTAVLSGEIKEIAKRNILTVPRELTADEDLASRPDATGSRSPVRTSYSIRVKLDEHVEPLLIGARGHAKISVNPQPLAQRVLRILRRTLTVQM